MTASVRRVFEIFEDDGMYDSVVVCDDADGLDLFEVKQGEARVVMTAAQAQRAGAILKKMAEGDYNGLG